MKQQNLFGNIAQGVEQKEYPEIDSSKDKSWMMTPLVLLEPLSDGWFNSIALGLTVHWSAKDSDMRRFDEAVQHLIDHRAWEHFPRGNPAGSPNKLLAMILDMELAEFEAQYKSRMIETARAMGPRSENGGEREGAGRKPNTAEMLDDIQPYNCKAESSDVPYGNNGIYLIQRALRDCPEKVDELQQGKYPSVYAMAISAGFIKKREQVSWLDVDGLAKSLRKKLTEEERTELIQKLR